MFNVPYGVPNYYNQNTVLNPMNGNYGIRQEIIRVNGENGARAFQMQPNSSALLLDESAPIIWLAQTDGAGYKTVQAYEIKPYQVKPDINISDLETRIERIEAIINESNTANNTANKPSQKHN